MSGYAVLGALLGWWAATGEKTQAVRLLDVLVIGPALLFAAPRPLRDLIGAATISYNLRNFLLHARGAGDAAAGPGVTA